MRWVLISLFAWASLGVAAPKISSPEQNYDFGKSNYVQELSHTFTIKNTGDAALDIRKVKACCGSTATISTNSIPPGSSATIDVKVINVPKQGTVRKTIVVFSNDENQPAYMMTFQGAVVPAQGVSAHEAATTSAAVAQKDCPFKDEPIQAQYYFDHKEKRIYTCCPECLEVVKVNPELAVRRLAEKKQFPILVKDAQ